MIDLYLKECLERRKKGVYIFIISRVVYFSFEKCGVVCNKLFRTDFEKRNVCIEVVFHEVYLKLSIDR